MLMRWTPTGDLTSLHGAVDRLIEQLAGGQASWGRGALQTFQLPVDVVETESGYRIEAPIPGFKPEEVEVTFSNGLLNIRAEHREERRDEEGDYVRREMVYGNMFRQLGLPSDVKGDDIRAEFEDGVLRIEVPKTRKPQPKRISVARRTSQRSGEQAKLQGDGNTQESSGQTATAQSREKAAAKSR
jgi:HSP20 family protein